MKMPVPSNRVVRIAWSIAGLVAILVLAGTVVALIQMSTNYESLDDRSGKQARALDAVIDTNTAQDEALKEANRRLRENDLPPVTEPPEVDPEIIDGAEIQDAEIDQPEIQDAEIDQPEIQEREIQNLEIDQPEVDQPEPNDPEIPGRDGKDATVEQISASVVEYCSARGDCLGAKGDPGPVGPPGADGANGVDGKDAVPFTFLFTIPADETLPDVSPAQTYSCVIPEPGGPFACELVPA